MRHVAWVRAQASPPPFPKYKKILYGAGHHTHYGNILGNLVCIMIIVPWYAILDWF